MDPDFDRTDTELPVSLVDDRPVVMLIHGMWSRPPIWDNFRTFFEGRGYRVVVPVLRHHTIEPGDTPNPELAVTSLADYADDLAKTIRKLDRKPLVVGHSMGGLLAQMLAARNLTLAVVALAPAQCAGTFNFDLRSSWIFRREFTTFGFWRQLHLPTFSAMRYSMLNRMPENEARQIHDMLIPESGRTLLEIGWWFFDRRRTTWINPADIRCPMLFLTGTADRLTPLWLTKRVAKRYEDRALVEALKNHSHWLPGEPGWEIIAARAAHFFEEEAPALGRKLESQSDAGISAFTTVG